MSRPVVIPWLPVNNTLVAPLQSLAAAGNLNLNSKVPGQPQGAFIYDRVIRDITIRSVNNLSAVNFTITGIGSPVDANLNPTQVLGLISETISGPNGAGNPKDSANIYSQIISISTDAPANAVSVGSGQNGITDYVFLDYDRPIFQASVQLQFNPRTTSTVTVYQSLTKPQVIDINAGNLVNIQPIPAFAVSALLTDATTNQLGLLQSPVSLAWAAINGATTDSIIFTVLQQGIN